MNKSIWNALIFIGALVAMYLKSAEYESLYVLAKPVTSALVIGMALMYGNKKAKPFYHYIVVALVFSLIGDVFLLSEKGFIWGLLSFLTAHLLFAKSFISIGGFKKYLAPIVVLLAVGLAIYQYIFPFLGDLRIPVSVYILVILFMCWQGINLFIWRKETAFGMIAMGVIFFLISDAILALNKFADPIAYSDFLILSTYWLSITLIANAATLVQEKNR